MNDFTKDELEDIYYAISEYGDLEGIDVSRLASKIQSLIDNFHENDNHETKME